MTSIRRPHFPIHLLRLLPLVMLLILIMVGGQGGGGGGLCPCIVLPTTFMSECCNIDNAAATVSATFPFLTAAAA